MRHFDEVAPGDVHRVIDERLIADPEAEIRRLLDYLGVPFDEACLNFHETKRRHPTASSEQVRRPISTDSAEQRRRFEQRLHRSRPARPALERWQDSTIIARLVPDEAFGDAKRQKNPQHPERPAADDIARPVEPRASPGWCRSPATARSRRGREALPARSRRQHEGIVR